MYYALVVFDVFIAALAQMLLKSSSMTKHKSFIFEYLNFKVIGGYCIMVVSLLLNIYAMHHGVLLKELSTIESSSYMFVPLLSFIFFKERITWHKAGAIAVIMVGVVVFFI
jgi:drug/metabolite transporter (DMT)-like permease